MTLREWCQREGHPLAIHVYQTHEFGAPYTRGRVCVCGERADYPRDRNDAPREILRLSREAIDAEGPVRVT